MLRDFVVLGANSALPLVDRFSSSFVLRTSSNYFLLDAGEGCQIKLGQFKIKRSKISHIFISHLHGDHIFGLPGLITSFNLSGRKDKMTVYGPQGIKKFVEVTLQVSQSKLNFELELIELFKDNLHIIAEINDIKVSAFPLKHRIQTYGYRFVENKVEINVRIEKIEEHKITRAEINALKEGHDLKRGEETLANKEMTFIKRPMKSLAYCSDTVYDESLTDIVKNVNLLYHEATYLENLRLQADQRMHTTAKGAARIAQKANVEKLVIGHFSSRYKDIEPLLEEAKKYFPNSFKADEGSVFTI